jgi:hypothetical protein
MQRGKWNMNKDRGEGGGIKRIGSWSTKDEGREDNEIKARLPYTGHMQRADSREMG